MALSINKSLTYIGSTPIVDQWTRTGITFQPNQTYVVDSDNVARLLATGLFAGRDVDNNPATGIPSYTSAQLAAIGGAAGLGGSAMNPVLAYVDGVLNTCDGTAYWPVGTSKPSASTVFSYYVDSVGGNDNNAGTSSALALQSLNPLNALSLPSGTAIGIKKGSTLYSTLNQPNASGIIIDVYGTGATPLIDCTDILPTTGWTKTGGLTNVYQQTITLSGNIKSSGNVFAAGVAITQVTSTALCDSTANSAYVSNWTATSATLYINIGGGNPAVSGVEYRYSNRLYAILLGDSADVRNITTRGSAHQDGSLVTGSNSKWTGVRVEWGSRHNSLALDGLIATNCTFIHGRNDLEAQNPCGGVVLNPTDATGKTAYFDTCTFDRGNGQSTFGGLLGHGSVATQSFGSITFKNCTFNTLGYGAFIPSTNLTLNNSTFTNCITGIILANDNNQASLSNNTGSLNQLYLCSAKSTTVTSSNNTFTIPALDDKGFYGSTYGAGSSNVFNVSGDVLFVTSAPNVHKAVFYINDGTINRTGMNVGPNNMKGVFRYLDFNGTTGGSNTVIASNNAMPYGADYVNSNVTYSLPEMKSLRSTETGSTSWGTGGGAGASSVTYTDTFTRADENLSANANWTLIDGAAGSLGIRSNKLALLSTAQSSCSAPDTGSVDHYMEFTVGVAGTFYPPFPMVCKLVDSQNYIGVGWNASGYSVNSSIANAYTTVNAKAQVPVVGDVIRLAVKGSTLTLYINEKIAFYQTPFTAPTLLASTKAGVISRGYVQNPTASKFLCGPI